MFGDFAMHCHDSQLVLNTLDPTYLQLCTTLFFSGLAGSFSHCIWMCGPIAISQMSMRMMLIPNSQMSELNKIKSAAAAPYYIGKAITYSILTLFASIISIHFRSYPFFQYFGALVLCLAMFFFIKSGISAALSVISESVYSKGLSQYIGRTEISSMRRAIKFLEASLVNKISVKHISPYNIKGLILGMILGLIPCGLVYANISLALSATDNSLLAALAMFIFGMATIPGLFIVSYIGSSMFEKYKKAFSLLHMCAMFFNTYLLVVYIMRILN